MKFRILSIALLMIPGMASAGNNCPSTIKALLHPKADVKCTKLDSNGSYALLGRGLIDSDGRFGLNFYFPNSNYSSIGVLVTDFALRQIYTIQQGGDLELPAPKNPKDLMRMAELRLRAELSYSTQKQWEGYFYGINPFANQPGVRLEIGSVSLDQTGWNWSSKPQVVSQNRIRNTLEILYRARALKMRKFCQYIDEMNQLSGKNYTRQTRDENYYELKNFPAEDQWLMQEVERCAIPSGTVQISYWN